MIKASISLGKAINSMAVILPCWGAAGEITEGLAEVDSAKALCTSEATMKLFVGEVCIFILYY
jgi:hypothetical protein